MNSQAITTSTSSVRASTTSEMRDPDTTLPRRYPVKLISIYATIEPGI